MDAEDDIEFSQHDLYLRGLLTKGMAEDLEALMSTPWGRRVAFWFVFDLSALYGQVFDPSIKHESEVVAALADGRRNVGRDLFDLVNALVPDQVSAMVDEHTDGRKAIDRMAHERRRKFFRGTE